MAHEREYAPYADAVITVSDALADLLVTEHGLKARPTVVMNAPEVRHGGSIGSAPSIRAVCGLDPEIPLLVYSGAAAPQRGLGTVIEALALLPEVHLALVVATPSSAYVVGLRKRATELGVDTRVHLVGYVPVDEIVPFLSSADVGLIPILHYPNHEIALITKFLEYSHARLPIVVSDVRTMAETVRRTGQGEVFEAENVADFARSVRSVLADPDRYRRAYHTPGLLEEWTWENSAKVLDSVYERLRADQLSARSTRR